MDTNSKAVMVSKRRGSYRHHPLALKRAIVEETLQPGASVAQIARKHGVNANLVFLWLQELSCQYLTPAKDKLELWLTTSQIGGPQPPKDLARD